MAKTNAVVEVKKETPKMSLAMPNSFVQSLAEPSEIIATSSFSSPYVTFPSGSGKQWKNLIAKIPGLQEYDPVFVYPNGDCFKLEPMRFSIMSGYQFWTQENAAGEILKVKFEQDKDWKEYLDTVLIIYLKDRCEMVRCSWKTTKTPAIKKGFKILEEAKDDSRWMDKSMNHKQTVQMNLEPNLRFFMEVNFTKRISKTSGLPYIQADAVDSPTTSAEWQLIGEMFKREGFDKAMADIMNDVDYRKKNLNSKVAK